MVFAEVAEANSAKPTAVLVILPGAVGVATTSIVAESPFGTTPNHPKVHPT